VRPGGVPRRLPVVADNKTLPLYYAFATAFCLIPPAPGWRQARLSCGCDWHKRLPPCHPPRQPWPRWPSP